MAETNDTISECYFCKIAIYIHDDNWMVVNNALCSYVMCESCCDEVTYAEADDEAEEEIDLSTLKNALEEDSDSDEEMN